MSGCGLYPVGYRRSPHYSSAALAPPGHQIPHGASLLSPDHPEEAALLRASFWPIRSRWEDSAHDITPPGSICGSSCVRTPHPQHPLLLQGFFHSPPGMQGAPRNSNLKSTSQLTCIRESASCAALVPALSLFLTGACISLSNLSLVRHTFSFLLSTQCCLGGGGSPWNVAAPAGTLLH